MGCCESVEESESKRLLQTNGLIQADSYYYSEYNTLDEFLTSRNSVPWNFDKSTIRLPDKSNLESQAQYDVIIREATSKLIDMSQGDDILNQRYQDNPYMNRIYAETLKTTPLHIPKLFSMPTRTIQDKEDLEYKGIDQEEKEWLNQSIFNLTESLQHVQVNGEYEILGYLSQE